MWMNKYQMIKGSATLSDNVQGSHSTWKTWKNEGTPGKPGNIMEF